MLLLSISKTGHDRRLFPRVLAQDQAALAVSEWKLPDLLPVKLREFLSELSGRDCQRVTLGGVQLHCEICDGVKESEFVRRDKRTFIEKALEVM